MVATTTSPAKLDLLREMGADAVVMDGLDAESVHDAVVKASPVVVVHQMTAISPVHAGKPDVKHMDRWFARTIRLRTAGTDNLLAAAAAAEVPHVVAQSYASWNGIREGGWVKTEDDPLDLHVGTPAHPGMLAIKHVEQQVLAVDGAALRYGGLYGPGAVDDQVELVRKRQYPLIGDGGGYSSWIHLGETADDAAEVARADARRVGGRRDDDRGPRVLQHQGEARARMAAAVPVVAGGVPRRAGLTRTPPVSRADVSRRARCRRPTPCPGTRAGSSTGTCPGPRRTAGAS